MTRDLFTELAKLTFLHGHCAQAALRLHETMQPPHQLADNEAVAKAKLRAALDEVATVTGGLIGLLDADALSVFVPDEAELPAVAPESGEPAAAEPEATGGA